MKYSGSLFTILFFFSFFPSIAQRPSATKATGVFVDKQGVMRWKQNNSEATFFGINYTVPFAYGYRSHKALNKDLEKAIDEDVYHFARLGLDAFRVHVWDTEITDSSGNLLENEHLRLFDYLLFKLKERNIRIFFTPIAFWGSGYPERDEPTPGFSSIYPKRIALVTERAIQAQANYIQQILKHVNPYTKLTYVDDPDIIAMEINNEPHHSGPKENVTAYINRMVKAAKSSGWIKPIFYNISESPSYADAVSKADIQGVSFQWYPTGLVANHMLEGNFLPNVDRYRIPFDTIKQYAGKALMVYEFDAGDIKHSYMYPAMARAFRQAGFQWATQFAYDPIATAYGNTEYQTHYLNLAYTPSKAISLMIASKAFHKLPRLKNFGSYPADTLFDVFRVSYRESLSEMNSDAEFYYSNSTITTPLRTEGLRKIAGVGSSPVIKYDGFGAYFLDRLTEGVWRLEVMPDAVSVCDPFEKASPKKEVTRIEWNMHRIQIRLQDLGDNFKVSGLNNGNAYTASAINGYLFIKPGTYLVRHSSKDINANSQKEFVKTIAPIRYDEFVAPPQVSHELLVMHKPFDELTADQPVSLSFDIAGIDTSAKVSIEMRHSSGKWKSIVSNRLDRFHFSTEVPVDMLTKGILNYRAIIQKTKDSTFVFPGNHFGDPYAWDNYKDDTWQSRIVSATTPIEIFTPSSDRSRLNIYNPDWRNNKIELTTSDVDGEIVLRMTSVNPTEHSNFGWQYNFARKIQGRTPYQHVLSKLILRGASSGNPVRLKVALIGNDATCYSTEITIAGPSADYEMPFTELKNDSFLLLPRPYPGFMPLRFATPNKRPFALENMERIEITFLPGKPLEIKNEQPALEIAYIRLK